MHRPSYLDYVGAWLDAGEVVGEWRLLGLYTTAVYTGRLAEIPRLRRLAAGVLDRAGFPPSSHSGKDPSLYSRHTRDELLQMDEDELFEMAMGILALQERQRARSSCAATDSAATSPASVFPPRDRYNTDTHVTIQRILLRAFQGDTVDHEARGRSRCSLGCTSWSTSSPARPWSTTSATSSGSLPAPRGHGAGRSPRGADRNARRGRRSQPVPALPRAFPAGYRADFVARVGVADIGQLDRLDPDGDLRTHLHRPSKHLEGSCG